MGDAHGRVGRVDRLPARPGGAVDVDLQVAGVHVHVHVLGLGQHRHRGRGRVDPALRLRLRHPLHPVRPALELEHAVCAVALHREGVVAVAQLERLGLEAATLGVAGEHAVEVGGEQAGLLAARAGPDLDDHVLVVVRVRLDHREPDLLLELAEPVLRAAQQLAQLGSSPSSASSSSAPAASSVARRHSSASACAGSSCGRRGRPRRSAAGRRSPPGRPSGPRARRTGSRSARRAARSPRRG